MNTKPTKPVLAWSAAITGWLSLSTFTTFYVAQPSTSFAQGSAFTYQGRLNDGASPATGIYDLRFTLYDSLSAGVQQGGTITNTATAVSNGLFTVTLDFGNQFPGADRWLEIGVRTNGSGTFATLTPPQPITSTPYAVRAANFGGAITDAQLSTNIARLNGASQVFNAPLVFSNTSNTFTGNFSGNGAGVTNVSLSTLNGNGALSWGAFRPVSSLAVGDYPRSIVAVDVNGDSKVDLVSANTTPDTLSVLTNNGNGDFALASSPAVGVNPYSVAAADVNGDGKVDLISANRLPGTLSVLTNNGSGSFTLSSSPSVGVQPSFVVAADVSGDGKVDLISANDGNATLSVLTNNGSGGFVLSSSPSVGVQPVSVAAADVNGDGKVDLISADTQSHTLSVLTNNGAGGFALSATVPTGVNTYPSFVAAAEVNGDGKPDLISANANTATLLVLTNNGSGGFVQSSQPAVGQAPVSIAATDVNGDGKVDLVSANQVHTQGSVSVLTNNGAGAFTLSSTVSVGAYPSFVVAADMNGDGWVDLATATLSGNALVVLFNSPNVSGSFSGSFSGSASGTFSGSASGSFGGDGSALANAAGWVRSGANISYSLGNVGVGTAAPQQSLSVGAGLNLDQNNANAGTTASALTFGSASGEAIASKRTAGGNQFGLDFYTASQNRLSIANNGNVTIPSPGSVFFGSQTRQMLNLFGTSYGIGVQAGTMYFRTDLSPGDTFAGFRWYRGGAHADNNGNAGGGTELMSLGSSYLYVNGTFVSSSDRGKKENFKPVDPQAVLDKVAALPLTEWNYKSDTASRHIGPMAQDFHAAFGVGPDDKHIATVDADGVALAAIQGLNEKVEVRSQKSEDRSRKLEERLQQKETEITELKARLEKLERLLSGTHTEGN